MSLSVQAANQLGDDGEELQAIEGLTLSVVPNPFVSTRVAVTLRNATARAIPATMWRVRVKDTLAPDTLFCSTDIPFSLRVIPPNSTTLDALDVGCGLPNDRPHTKYRVALLDQGHILVANNYKNP
jgi:hypothetical protein